MLLRTRYRSRKLVQPLNRGTATPTSGGQRALDQCTAVVAHVLEPANRITGRGELFLAHTTILHPTANQQILRLLPANAQIL